VGEKTALKLVKQFGSLEKVFEHLDEINGKKLKENLCKFHDDALLSKRLTAIDCHVPMDVAVEDLKIGRPDKDALAEIFRELEFRGLLEKYSP
jgi:DNA polymerase-1